MGVDAPAVGGDAVAVMLVVDVWAEDCCFSSLRCVSLNFISLELGKDPMHDPVAACTPLLSVRENAAEKIPPVLCLFDCVH